MEDDRPRQQAIQLHAPVSGADRIKELERRVELLERITGDLFRHLNETTERLDHVVAFLEEMGNQESPFGVIS